MCRFGFLVTVWGYIRIDNIVLLFRPWLFSQYINCLFFVENAFSIIRTTRRSPHCRLLPAFLPVRKEWILIFGKHAISNEAIGPLHCQIC